MSDAHYKDRHDPEFADPADDWAAEGCLPETSSLEDDLARMEQLIKVAPEEMKEHMTDYFAAKAMIARENKLLADDVCKKVLMVLGIEDNEQNKDRVLKLVQNI